jgi:putative ABC transport system ATP-binding protein
MTAARKGATAAATARPLFEARDVARAFRSGSGTMVEAIAGVSISVPRGAFFAVTGPSGCGKTTLLTLLAALDRPSRGAVLFDGRDLGGASGAERSRVRRRLGLVFQHAPMIRGLPLWENVTYPLVPRGKRPRERRRIAAELLERVGVAGRENARPEELSGGERQRVGIARAFAAAPEAIVADEPTSNLDSGTAAAITDLFLEAHRHGTTILVATHDPHLPPLASKRFELGRAQPAGR